MNDNQKKVLQWGLLFVAYAIFFLPYFHSILYSVPTADDFSMIVNGKAHSGIVDDFILAINVANTRYMTWGGGWLSFFLQVFLNPILQFGYSGLRYGVSLVFNIGISLLGVGFAFNLIYKHLCKVEDKFWRMVLVLLPLGAILLSDVYIEIFNWFTGSTYLWWFALELLAIALMAVYFKEYNRKILIVLTIVGGIGCIGPQYCVPIGLTYLLFYVNDCMKNKKINLKRLLPLLVFVCCGLSSVLAPGNSARNEMLGKKGLEYKNAIYYACIDLKMILRDIIKNPYVVLLVASLFILGVLYNQKKKQEIKSPIIYFFIGIFIMIGKIYPVALGYGYYGTPNRVIFMLGSFMIAYYSVLLFWLGEYVAYKYKLLIKSKDVMLLLCMVGIYGYSAIIMTGNTTNSTWWKHISNYKAVEREHDFYIDVLSYIENSESDVVEVSEPIYKYTELIKPLYFIDDETYWINVSIARYFGKEGVRWIEMENK